MTLPEATGHRPLIKWPGGKGREWGELAPRLPRTVRHFVDPFMGGGAPFARTPFTGRAFLNDRHPLLVDLHRRVKRADAALFAELRRLADDWEALGGLCGPLEAAFADALDAARDETAVDRGALARVLDRRIDLFTFHRTRSGDRSIRDFLLDSLVDKAGRLARLERRHHVSFEGAELAGHLETAVRAAYYTLIRDHEVAADGAARAADFLFVRDFCYGSMFRTNADGRFNIPYGGRSYNAKSFHSRVDRIAAEDVTAALARASFACGDFEPFLAELTDRLADDDLVFADPPYHSDFSTYGEHAFDLVDHRRLAAALAALPCRWMLVIKETPQVRDIYLSPEMAVRGARLAHVFGKEYGYNVRGRNDRSARHLVVTNYPPAAEL